MKRVEVLMNHIKGDKEKTIKKENCSLVEDLRNNFKQQSTLDQEKLYKLLAHDNYEMRENMTKFLMNDKAFIPKYNISLEEEREVALFRLKKICDEKFFSVQDFKENPYRIFAAH